MSRLKILDFDAWKDERASERFPLIVDDEFIRLCRAAREAHRLANARQLVLPFIVVCDVQPSYQ